ncbi:NADH:flavin oxidoreductase, partial [Vibrio diabolicus]|nr:NADH:flavin oxidoreductase [Vibrio diabolicus]
HRPLLLAEIEKSGITVLKNHKAVEVRADGVVCENADGETVHIDGSSVICALGQRSRRASVDELWDCAPLVAQVGDCVKVSTITTAIYQGHHAALDI